MSKYNAKGRSKKTDSFIRLDRYLVKSPAYKALSHTAMAMLTQILFKYTGNNNGEIFISIRMAAELLACSPNTASKALHDLIDKGFIKPKTKGAFTYKQRHATEWIINMYEYNGKPATKEFMSYQVI